MFCCGLLQTGLKTKRTTRIFRGAHLYKPFIYKNGAFFQSKNQLFIYKWLKFNEKTSSILKKTEIITQLCPTRAALGARSHPLPRREM